MSQTKATPKKDRDYALITIGYNTLALPNDKALAVMEALSYAEELDRSNWKYFNIKPISMEITVTQLAFETYLEYKTRHLLGLTKPTGEKDADTNN